MPPFLPTLQLSNLDHQGTETLDLHSGMTTLKVNLILDYVIPEFNASMTVMKLQQTCSSEQRP